MGRRRFTAGKGSRGERQSREESVPSEYEPRTSHVTQRYYWFLSNPLGQNFWRPLWRMLLVYLCCRSFRSPKVLSERISEKPIIALSGVRKSWLIFARN